MDAREADPSVKAGLVTGGLAVAVIAGLFLANRGPGSEAENALDELARTEIRVNTEFVLEEQESMADGSGERIGTIAASYQGPDTFDAIEVTVYDAQEASDDAWAEHLDQTIRTSLSIHQPRFAGQICTLQNETVKCSVQMYEAIVIGMAGGDKDDYNKDTVKFNAQGLLMAGVKNWLDARDLGLPQS